MEQHIEIDPGAGGRQESEGEEAAAQTHGAAACQLLPKKDASWLAYGLTAAILPCGGRVALTEPIDACICCSIICFCASDRPGLFLICSTACAMPASISAPWLAKA